jgi:hypothetical protein
VEGCKESSDAKPISFVCEENDKLRGHECQMGSSLIKLRQTRQVQLSQEGYAGRSAGNG